MANKKTPLKKPKIAPTKKGKSKADDISDFQIEGISLGDSLTEYFTKKIYRHLLRSKIDPFLENRKYGGYGNTKDIITQAGGQIDDDEIEEYLDDVNGMIQNLDNLKELYQRSQALIEDLTQKLKTPGDKKDELEEELANQKVKLAGFTGEQTTILEGINRTLEAIPNSRLTSELLDIKYREKRGDYKSLISDESYEIKELTDPET